MNPKMISDDHDVFEPTCIKTNDGVFFVTFDGNHTNFADEDGDVVFSVWGNCTSEKVAAQFCKVWAKAFQAGIESGRSSKIYEIRLALGLG